MKKILFLFSIILLIGCRQTQKVENEDEKPQIEEPQPKDFTKNVENIQFKMIRIEAVKKTILGKGTANNERLVTLSPYYIAETEVTQELWKEVMGNNPSFFDNTGMKELKGTKWDTAPASGEIQEKRPVEWITWYECVAFCNELTKKLNNGNDAECVYKTQAEKAIIEKTDKNVPFVAEFLYLIPKAKLIENSADKNTVINTDRLSVLFRSISKMTGMRYHVGEKGPNDKGELLYKKAYMIANPDSDEPIADKNTGNADQQLICTISQDEF